MGESYRQIAPPRTVLLAADPSADPADDPAETGLTFGGPAGRPPVPARAEPSWGRVIADTVKLWVSRRFRRPVPRRRRLAVIFLALALVAAVTLDAAGVFTGTAARAARPSVTGLTGPARARSAPAQPGVARTRAEAAAWVAGQVSTSAMVGCDPVMCAVLQAHGVVAGRLVPLRSGSAVPGNANVLVTSYPPDRRLTDAYAPAVIASFGAGRTLIEVRVIAPGGVAAYESALRADLAARSYAGSQLLTNSRIGFTAQDAAQLRAGAVDSRLMATLAALSSVYSFRVTAFGDASPGTVPLFRAMTITSRGPGTGAFEPTAARALVSAQEPPYLPAHATIVAAAGQPALLVEFAAPSPLGLLTTVLTAHSGGLRSRALTRRRVPSDMY